MAESSKEIALYILVYPLLLLLSRVSLWSQAKHQNLAFKDWKCLSFSLSCLRSSNFCILHEKKYIFLPKNNFGFKCPLQRGWNNLSWTLRRQKKVIAWVSHHLQQGRQWESLLILQRQDRAFPACGFAGEEVAAQRLLWAICLLFWLLNAHHITVHS